MTPEFITLCSLATHANARIRRLRVLTVAGIREHDRDRFTFEVRSSTENSGRRQRVASSPAAWLTWLVRERCLAVSLTQAVPADTDVALRHILRLERYGTNTFAFLVLTFARSSMVWANTFEPIGEFAAGAREWRYVGIPGDVRPPPADGVAAARVQLTVALDRARRLAQVEDVLAHWIERFDRTSRALQSQAPLRDVPEAAAYPIAFCGLDLPASQLFAASILAQISGGMGSWMDAYLQDPSNDAEHLACGRDLHAAAMVALCTAVNASRPTEATA
jgi:hypothetical protein